MTFAAKWLKGKTKGGGRFVTLTAVALIGCLAITGCSTSNSSAAPEPAVNVDQSYFYLNHAP